MAMYSFIPPFCEAELCGVPLCVFDKLGCAAGEKSLRNTALTEEIVFQLVIDLGVGDQLCYLVVYTRTGQITIIYSVLYVHLFY
jgi:hypothetical protein